jgi:hypothetical protein
LRVAVRLAVVGLLLGWGYGAAGPHLYPEGRVFGAGWGVAHGACMPLALPALLLGQDPPIYAGRNSGRGYKLGYIAGINLCGLVFFGGAFWRAGSARNPESQNQRER